MNPIKNIVYYILDKHTSAPKIGFFINEEYIFDHYHNVMMELDNDRFDVILANKFKGDNYKKLIDRLISNSWNVVFLSDILYVIKYKILVSHLYLGGNTIDSGSVISRIVGAFFKIANKLIEKNGSIRFKEYPTQYFQNILGSYNIRFMYGADAGGQKFGEYNNLFDEFFCHGPRDSAIVREMFNKTVFEMGYPRYDCYFIKKDDAALKIRLIDEYLCDKNKKTILWICTVSEYFSTIETYAYAIQKLTTKYNIILRPHPLEIDPQYSRYNNPYQDMSELYLIADYVFCDYGGTIFSALYVDKNILLMNHKDVHMDHGVYGSTSMEVRKFLPSINETDADRIDKYLSDPEFWSKAKQKRKEARINYFGSSKGNSSKLVANELIGILNHA